ncbi:MAG TPA: FliA/WhiG family RNA polymerase sigma factor [Nocardioidaceae bacterium]|nr:FliA/WhiG family RNA polymerase sigma factor [Nocardioidaceae bacterium]
MPQSSAAPSAHPAPAPAAPSPAEVDDLVRRSLPLVGHLVREMLSRVPGHVSRDDLMSAGMVALVQAAQAFDPSRGVSFSGYASTRIRGAVVDELRGLDWASRSVRRRAREIDEARNRLTATLGRSASDAEVAAALGIGRAEIDAHHEDMSRAAVMSLQGFGEEGIDDILPARGLTPVDVLEQRERIGYLHDAVENLPERLRTVVEGYFFADRPMAELAEELGVSESRISQLRAEAIVLLKGALNAALDPELVAESDRPGGCAARRKQAYYASVAAHRSFSARLTPATPTQTYTA